MGRHGPPHLEREMSEMNLHRPATASRGTRGMKWMLLSLLVAASAAVALSAWAQPGPGGRHGGPGADIGWMGPMAGRGVDRMLDGVNATDAQRTQIKQITQAAAADLRAMHAQNLGLRERAMEVFTAPTVDANAAEAVRQQMLQQHDQASRRMMLAMLDVSRVLTPEQRATLAERMKQHADAMHERMQRRLERTNPQK
jgi:protein CpxP